MSEHLHLTIDGKPAQALPGETVLDAAARLGVDIPTLCHDSRLETMGCCRMCLVEVEGQRRLQPACTWKANEGQSVVTDSERVQRHQRLLLEMYLADHAPAAASNENGGEAFLPPNQVLELAERYGAVSSLTPVEAPRSKRTDLNPYITYDPAQCILCNRCVRYCDEVEAVSAITLVGRGSETTISTANDIGLLDSTCELCGGCIDTCPTGAMREKKPGALESGVHSELSLVRSTCNFCGVGCQVEMNVAGGRVVKVTSPPAGETLNDGNLCVKGRFAYDFVHHEDRLTTPLIREDGVLREATWDEALQRAAEGLLGVKERWGADALGFISSSRCTGEENYLVQKLARAAFGTNNCHQCAAT
jgi:predicted molibdopterin-dependent oxidoreductase YjgC